MAPDPKPRALELVESGTYGTQAPDAPATPHAMNTSPCATLAVRGTLVVIVLANVVLVEADAGAGHRKVEEVLGVDGGHVDRFVVVPDVAGGRRTGLASVIPALEGGQKDRRS